MATYEELQQEIEELKSSIEVIGKEPIPDVGEVNRYIPSGISFQVTQSARRGYQAVVVAPTEETITGSGQFYIVVDSIFDGMALYDAHAEVVAAGTTGTTDIQIHNVTQAVDMLATVLTIDSGETGSDTAATPFLVATVNATVRKNDVLRIDVDAVSTTAAQGLIINLNFKPF